MLSSCTYMGIKTQTEGPFAGSSCWAPVLQPAGSEVLSCTCSWGREQSKRWSCSACSSAVTVFDKVLVISGAEWGSLVEEGEDRWGRVSCSMGSGVSPSPHLPSASSFQTCKGRFFSWFYLDTTYIDGDFSSPLRSRSQELLNIWSTFQYHQVIESIQNLLNVKSVGASLDYGLKLLWADTQNLSRASPTYRVILDLWLMRFDNKLVLK